MKVAVVNHRKCGEYRESSYVCVDDDLALEQLHAHALTAQELYFKYEREGKATAPNYPQYPTINDKRFQEGITIAEARAQYERENTEYKEWQEAQNKSRRSFAELLIEAGAGKIRSIFNGSQLTTTINWGHNHGTMMHYGAENPNENDFNKQEEEDY